MPRQASANQEALRRYVAACSEWTASLMNKVSVGLLLIASSVDCLGKLWEHFLCMELGLLENLAAITTGTIMFLLSVPLLLDVSFLLMQRVHPVELVSLMKSEIASIKEDYGIVEPIKWHLWSLDKSQRVCTIQLIMPESEDADLLKREDDMRKDIQNRLLKPCGIC